MDDDQFELLRRRLSDEVRESVQARLFRTYFLAGSVAIAAFTYANWDFVEDTKAEVKANAEQSVRDAVSAATADIEKLKLQVTRQAGSIDAEVERADVLRSDVARKLRQLELDAPRLAALDEDVAALEAARRNLNIDIQEIKARTDTLAVLGDELKTVADRLRQLDGANAVEYAAVIEKVTKAQESGDNAMDMATVYLQFAGGTRARAKDLSDRLTAQGFFMPGEERNAGAAGIREIRYYHEEDEKAARALKLAVDQALQDMEAPPMTTVINDLTDWKRTKPKQGVIELWVEI